MSQDLKNQIFFDKYKIVKKLTEGGMDSDIYLAENIKYDKDSYLDNKYNKAIIKIIHKNEDTSSDQWIKLLDEGVTAGRISHRKNIVKLFNYLNNEDTIVIAMEYVDGPSLSRYILDNGWLAPLEAIWIFREILIAVQQLHDNKKIIIHRDLKPDNILLSKDLVKVRLIDFGISSVIEKSSFKNNFDILTNEDSFYGTIPYISPDILKFKGKDPKNFGHLITKQFDFFSLGIIFFEMLTGKKPFIYENEDDPASIKVALNYDIPSIKEVNSAATNDLENMIIKMTTCNYEYVNHHYNDIQEIIDDLNRAEQKIINHEKEDELLIPMNKRRIQVDKEKKNIPINKKDKIHYLVISLMTIFGIIGIVSIILFILMIVGVI